jgi:(1->4)-alpha-D-glucan 1-alpha-D-glucosylmutase
MKQMTAEQVWSRMDSGLPKMWLIRKILKLRHERQLFAPEHSYRAVVPRGAKSAHVIAFVRGERAATVVPRWSLKRGNWGDTAIEIPNGTWRNALTNESVDGGEILITDLLKSFPVALLSREEEAS